MCNKIIEYFKYNRRDFEYELCNNINYNVNQYLNQCAINLENGFSKTELTKLTNLVQQNFK